MNEQELSIEFYNTARDELLSEVNEITYPAMNELMQYDRGINMLIEQIADLVAEGMNIDEAIPQIETMMQEYHS